MMLRTISVRIAVVLATAALLGCPPPTGDLIWARSFGGDGFDAAASAVAAPTGGYVAVGRTDSFGAGFVDMYIVRMDKFGDPLWGKYYGGVDDDFASDVVPTADGGYLLAGHTTAVTTTGAMSVYVVKTNDIGHIDWSYRYRDGVDQMGRSVIRTSDGGFAITGIRYSAPASDLILIRLDAAGTEDWTRAIGGADRDIGSDLVQTADGGFAIAGATASSGAGERDLYLVKTNDLGGVEWSQTYGGTADDVAQGMDFGIDSGYVLCGSLFSAPSAGDYDAYVLKTDDAGVLEWDWVYGGAHYDGAVSVCTVHDGYVVAIETVLDAAGGERDIILGKLDPDGALLWVRRFGGAGTDIPQSVRRAADGGFVIAGWTGAYRSNPGDMYVLKTDSMGYGTSVPTR